jgi:hypothetical protein
VVLARATAGAATATVLALAALRAYGGPLPVSDQNPLMTGFGRPLPVAARLAAQGETSASLAFNWSSTAAIQRSDREQLIMDVESREWRVTVDYGLTDAWTVRASIPYREIAGGSLDSFVEDWHSLFGFPDGDRPRLPQDALLVDYRRDGNSILRVDADAGGIGDISLETGWQWFANETRATALWGAVKLPTGDASKLNGSDTWGASLTLAHQRELSSRWSAFAQGGATYLAKGSLLPAQQKEWLARGTVGLDYRYSPALSLTLQLDGHSGAYRDSSLRMFGPAWILTVGGEYRFASRWIAQFALAEDVRVESSPDVSFIFSLAKQW